MDRAVAIADAVVLELNDGSRVWQPLFTAEREWQYVFKAEDLQSVYVTVTPVTLQLQKADRGIPGEVAPKNSEAYGAVVILSRNVESEIVTGQVDKAAIDNLNMMAQQIFDFYKDWHYLTTTVDRASRPTWKVMDVQRPMLFDPDWLREHGIWQSEIQITVQGTI